MTNSFPQVKPQVLGLVVDADHEISTNDGTIYIQLHPTDDEMYAEVHFNFEMDYEYVAPEYMDGYLMCGGVQLGKHNITSWAYKTTSPLLVITMVMAMICLVGLVLRAKIAHQLSCLSSSTQVKWRTGNHCPIHQQRNDIGKFMIYVKESTKNSLTKDQKSVRKERF